MRLYISRIAIPILQTSYTATVDPEEVDQSDPNVAIDVPEEIVSLILRTQEENSKIIELLRDLFQEELANRAAVPLRKSIPARRRKK